MLRFRGWLNQTQTDFSKARGLAISATKDALETGGSTLPEPIYRLRFVPPVGSEAVRRMQDAASADRRKPAAVPATAGSEALDVTPDHHIEKKVDEERAETMATDLLDSRRPVE